MSKHVMKEVHTCNKCSFMKAVPSLFPEFKAVECQNKVYRTLNLIPSGGGSGDEMENIPGMVSV